MLELTGVNIIFSKFVPIVANDTVDSTNGVIGCRKNVQGYKQNTLVPGIAFICQEVLDLNMAGTYIWCYRLIMIVRLIEQGQVIIPTGLMIKGSRPFYWILLKEAN